MYFVTIGQSHKLVKTSFGTKKAALEHARFALKVGVTVACVVKRSPVTGSRLQVRCVKRTKR